MMTADTPPIVPVTESCIVRAAERFDLPVVIIESILKVEGGTVGETSRNTNGTYDMGPMQINTLWLPKFSGYMTQQELIHDGCKNVMAGAWILKANINKAGDFWHGVGNYHSRTEKRNHWYQWKVYDAYLSLR